MHGSRMIVAALTLVVIAACGGADATSDVGRPNPAQPVANVEPIRQGDPCQVNGSTAVNEKGQAFDCERWGADPGLRWVNP